MNEPDVSGVAEVTKVAGALGIAIHPCLKRHKSDSRFSHFAGSDEELIQLAITNFDKQLPGKYPRSLIIPVPPEKFFAHVPQGTHHLEDSKPPAERVNIVLHSRKRLEEVDKEENLPPDVDWFIVSINAVVRLN